jgi:hypothetical protein
MPIPPDTLTTTLLPRILTPATSVAELLALFQQQPQPRACYAVVRLAADAYDVLALADLTETTQQHGQALLSMSLREVPGLLKPAAPVRQVTTGQAAAERKLHASPRRRLVVLDAHGDVPGILVSHPLSVSKGADPLTLLTPAVLGEEAPTLLPHLNTRFEGFAPDQPLPVGQRVPFVVWVGVPTGQRSEPFQFTFPDAHTPVTFTVQLHAVPDTWTVKVVEPTMIVAPPGTTTQEAEFLVTAKQPGRDTLFVTVARADTGVTVQHLTLPVQVAAPQAPPPPPVAREPVEVSFPLEDTSSTRPDVKLMLRPGDDVESFMVIVDAELHGQTILETYRVPISAEEIQTAALRLRHELTEIVFYPGRYSGQPHPFASRDTLTVDETLARETAVALADAGHQVWHLLFQSPPGQSHIIPRAA